MHLFWKVLFVMRLLLDAKQTQTRRHFQKGLSQDGLLLRVSVQLQQRYRKH